MIPIEFSFARFLLQVTVLAIFPAFELLLSFDLLAISSFAACVRFLLDLPQASGFFLSPFKLSSLFCLSRKFSCFRRLFRFLG
ncbi:hypothetical protein WJ70_06915 [Burkholderia ubonensis]|nr:hypothetical protein WJ70_06915 [Burkholderia ubonensis]